MTTEFTLDISLDNLTISDLITFDKFAAKEATNAELVGLLDKVVVGGAGHLPFKALPKVMEALKVALENYSNPKAAEGN